MYRVDDGSTDEAVYECVVMFIQDEAEGCATNAALCAIDNSKDKVGSLK